MKRYKIPSFGTLLYGLWLGTTACDLKMGEIVDDTSAVLITMHESTENTKNSFLQNAEKPTIGNLLTVIMDASHDIGQRNPERAWEQRERIDLTWGSTPYQDRQRRGNLYKNGRELWEYVDDWIEDH